MPHFELELDHPEILRYVGETESTHIEAILA